MQDIHAGSGRLFAGGSGGGGDRRLRPHHNHNQALKCPRCDSLNTKFCYYNNYNLSQPRHFCKNCRRYWTKGGVLRNVPVGGGCRKTKRSKPKQPPVSTDAGAGETAAGAAAATNTPAPMEQNSNSHSNSSSESSSLTATTTAAKKISTPPAGTSGEVASATVGDSRFFIPQMNHFQPMIDPAVTSDGQVYAGEMGSFTSLMTSSSNESAMLGFNNMTHQLQQSYRGSVVEDQSSNQMVGNELKMEEEQVNCGFLDQTAQIGFPLLEQSRISNGGLSSFDWQINGGGGGGDGGGGEQGFFDFTGTVDQAYWSQNHWADNDQSLNFPPLV